MFPSFDPKLLTPTRRDVLLGAMASTVVLPFGSAGLASAQQGPAGTPASSEAAKRAVEAYRDVILRISHEVWENAELSLHEEVSAEIHLRELREAGFEIVSVGTSNIPTAFVAEWSQGDGGPKVGFLPEYDALPGLGNAAEPRQTPGPRGVEVGHGCGHNMLGAGCTGAAMALKQMMMEDGTPGTVRVYGCAAEETEGAKVYMARDGLFDDLDACLAWHPAPVTAAGLLRTAALDRLQVTWQGQTAHAGVDPWTGRSALKGAEIFATGIQFMREHLKSTTRLHYVYTAAGEAPNVVPDQAGVLIIVRDASREEVAEVTEWVREIAEGSALMTQTEVQVEHFFGMHDLLPNEPLARRIYDHIAAVPVVWTEQEQAFAAACQAGMGLEEAGLDETVLPFLPEITSGGSTDVGDVSYNTPTGVFAWTTIPRGVGLHTWPVTACSGTTIGDKGALNSAIVMAGVGYDVMTDAAFREDVRADFQTRLGGRTYVSPLPEGKIRPHGVPPHLLLRDGTGELTDEFYELGG